MKKSIFTILILAVISSCSSEAETSEDKEQGVQTENSVIDGEEANIEDDINAIDSTWNYYAGTAGIYDSQLIMELSFNGSDVNGSYWYAKHKKRLTLTGTFNEKDQKFELDESYKGELTGRITFSVKNNELVGRWYAPKSTGDGESFYAEKIVSDSEKHISPVFEEYKFDHLIDVYDSELDDFKHEDASDYCMISKISDEKFMFVYGVIGHNYHVGHIEGVGTYTSPTKGQFSGEEGCLLNFTFEGDEVTLLEDNTCSYYKGARAYFGGTLKKIK